MLTKERPHLTRCVDVVARPPDNPLWHRLAARPGMASSPDSVEHHGRVISTIGVLEAGDIPRLDVANAMSDDG